MREDGLEEFGGCQGNSGEMGDQKCEFAGGSSVRLSTGRRKLPTQFFTGGFVGVERWVWGLVGWINTCEVQKTESAELTKSELRGVLWSPIVLSDSGRNENGRGIGFNVWEDLSQAMKTSK